jgi:photosystem II stability/assembly factor-like uncharacterized protein
VTSTSSQAKNRRIERKNEAQRRVKQRRRQRALGSLGIAVLVVAVSGFGAWRLLGGTETSGGQPLHQFDTRDFHSLAFDPDDADTIFFGHHGGMMISHDAGITWQPGPPRNVDVMQQAIPAADPNRRYVAGHDVFQVSVDGGETWDVPGTNLPSLDIHGFAAAPSDPDRLYAFEAQSTGFYVSVDGGTTWEARALPLGMRAGTIPLVVAADDSEHVYAGVGGKVAESRDGGRTWQESSDLGDAIIGLAVDPTDSSVLFAATSDGLQKRESGGNWTKLPITPDGVLLAIAVHPRDPERIAVIDRQGNFYLSSDGSKTWVDKQGEMNQ